MIKQQKNNGTTKIQWKKQKTIEETKNNRKNKKQQNQKNNRTTKNNGTTKNNRKTKNNRTRKRTTIKFTSNNATIKQTQK